MMMWRRVFKSVQVVLAHGLLFIFTLVLSLKIPHVLNFSWWWTFSPLWLFHAVVARGRFSLPAPSMPHGRHWAPFHAIVAAPLLVAFEILLCVHLERSNVVNLKIVFVPLLALEIAILVDNIRMCRAIMPGEEENISDEAIWETLPHFWVSISMVFFLAATIFTLLKLCGDVAALGWWDLFINYGVAECFAFLICTKWYNPAIHRHNDVLTQGSSSSLNIRNLNSSSSFRFLNSSSSIRSLQWNGSIFISPEEDDQQGRLCSLQDIGGHVMKIPFIAFQVMLFMYLEGTPPGARNIPIPVLFIPLLLLQGVGFSFAIYRLFEKISNILNSEEQTGSSFRLPQTAYDYMGIMRRGSRLLGWWSIDEGSREEQARLFYSKEPRYGTFSPEVVKKMPRAELANEILKLQSALATQTEITNTSQEEFERLQTEKILCRVCFDDQISIVLLPCRHYVLCSFLLMLRYSSVRAVRSAKDVRYVVSLSRIGCPYLMYSY